MVKAKENHPDANLQNPKAAENFQKIQGAFETLSDPDAKIEYDRTNAPRPSYR